MIRFWLSLGWLMWASTVLAMDCDEALQRVAMADYAGALEPAQACLSADPEAVESWTLMARVLGGMGRHEQALGWAE